MQRAVEATAEPVEVSEATSKSTDLSGRQLFALAFGAIIGVSWLMLVGDWIRQAGSFGAMLAFVLGGALIVPVGLCYARLGQRYPSTGGEIVYAYRFFGSGAGFCAAWTLALVYISLCGFEAVSVAWILSEIFAFDQGEPLYQFAGASVFLADLCLALVFTLVLARVHIGGLRMAASFQDATTLLLVLVTFCFLGLAFYGGSPQNLQPLFADSATDSSAAELGGFMTLLLVTPLFFAGFGAVPQALGESSERARKRLPAIVVCVIGASILFYVAVIFSTAYILPFEQIANRPLPVAAAFELAFGSELMAKLVLFAGLLGLLTTWNAVLFSATRVVFVISNAQLALPGFRRRNRHGSAGRAIWLVSVVTLMLAMAGRQALLPIVTIGGVAICLMFLLVGFCTLKMQIKEMNAIGWKRLLPALTIAIAGGLLAINLVYLFGNAQRGEFTELGVILVWVLTGATFWWRGRHYRGSVTDAYRRQRIMGKVDE
ncbi:APC family permease [Pseudomaricurvus alkylphenolicus]|uniref:APC family permease n=1 Tax=Pseudomaricurvus alkylphenolicus TaxID=1306991 RepID=UPI00141D928A|nr:APC family permease [Pseudomaricurvus alkylphenolicus]NIB40607.1 APC family permease [Pseudomaricurvus alkylphenolicus]